MAVDWSQDVAEFGGQNRQLAEGLTTDVKPDDAATAVDLSKTRQDPASYIAQNLQLYKDADQQNLGWQIIQGNSHLRNWLQRDPVNPMLVSSDLANLNEASQKYKAMAAGSLDASAFIAAARKHQSEGASILAHIPGKNILTALFGTQEQVAQAAQQDPYIQAAKGWVEGFGQEPLGQPTREALTRELSKVFPPEAVAPWGPTFRMIGQVAEPFARSVPAFLKALYEGVAVYDPRLARDLAGEAERRFWTGDLPSPAFTELQRAAEARPQLIQDFIQQAQETATARERAYEAFRAAVVRGTAEAAPREAGTQRLLPSPEMIPPEGMRPVGEPRITTGRPSPEEIAEFKARARQITEEGEAARPFVEADEIPPAGVSPIADTFKVAEAERGQELIKDALDAANDTELKERSPGKFLEFLLGHPESTISISKEAIAANPDAFWWVPDLQAKFADANANVDVPGAEFLHNFDPKNWDAVKDDVSRGGLSVNQAKELPVPEPPDEARLSIAKEISDGMEKTGVEPDRASDIGEIAGNWFARLAERTGRTLGDFYAEDKLAIERQEAGLPPPPGRVLYMRSVPGFHSYLKQGIQAVQMKAGNAQQWVNAIKKMPGVTQEAMDWMGPEGIEQWLKDAEKDYKGKVPKEEVIKFITAHQMQFEEQIRSEAEMQRTAEVVQQIADARAIKRQELQDLQRDVSSRLRDQYMNAPGIYEERLNRLMSAVDNHPEVLAKRQEIKDLGTLAQAAQEEEREAAPKWMRYMLPGGTHYGNLIVRLPGPTVFVHGDIPIQEGVTHFPTPNMIAHVRHATYQININGQPQPVLMILEIQSDWHQLGRKYGYSVQDTDMARQELEAVAKTMELAVDNGYSRLREAIKRHKPDITADELRMAIGGTVDQPLYDPGDLRWYEIDNPEIRGLIEQIRDLKDGIRKNEDERRNIGKWLPNAPLKTAWPEFIIKRMIYAAAEGGAERIGWAADAPTVAKIERWSERFGKPEWDPVKKKWHMEGDYTYDQIFKRYTETFPKEVKNALKPFGPVNIITTDIPSPPLVSPRIDRTPSGEFTITSEVMGDFGYRERRLVKEGNRIKSFATRLEAQDYIDNLPPVGQISYVELPEELRQRILSQGFPILHEVEGVPLGRTTFSDLRTLIEMLPGANAVTGLHEITHVVFNRYLVEATKPDAPQELVNDLGIILKTFGATTVHDLTTANLEDLVHLMFQYIQEGKAPTKELQPLFDRIGGWTLDLSRYIRKAGVPLSDEMRGVFNRMLADDAALDGIRKAGGLDAILAEPVKEPGAPPTGPPEGAMAAATPEEMAAAAAPPAGPPGAPPAAPPPAPPAAGLPPLPFTEGRAMGQARPEYRKLLELIDKHEREDVAWRLRRAVKAAERENSAQWRSRAAELASEIRGQIEASPEINAWNWLQNGMLGGQKATRLKLSPSTLREMVRTGQITRATMDALPRNWLSERNAKHPDVVADLLKGFDSGAEFVNKMATIAEAVKGQRGDIVTRMVNGEVQRQLEIELGPTAQERLAEAKDHALSLTTMEMLHEQTLALGQRIKAKLPLSKAAMDYGSVMELGATRAHGLTAMKLLQQAGRSLNLAKRALLMDKPLEAYQHLQAHYKRTAMSKEMVQVEKEAARFYKEAKRLRVREPEGLNQYAVNFAHDILTRVGMPVARFPQDLAGEIAASPWKTFADFLNDREMQGYGIDVPEWLATTNMGKDLKEMTVAEQREIFRAIHTILVAARGMERVGLAGQRMALEDFLTQAYDELIRIGRSLAVRGPERGWNARTLGRAYIGIHLQIEFLFNRFDHDNPWGIFNQVVMRPLVDAASYEARLQQQFARKLLKIKVPGRLNQKIPQTLFRTPYVGPNEQGIVVGQFGEPMVFRRRNLLAVMSNMGNADNFRRLAEGWGIPSKDLWDFVHQHATKEDWDFVQARGDIYKESKRLSDEVARRLTGTAPQAIPLVPFQTRFGEYSGFYHPVIHLGNWPTGAATSESRGVFGDNYSFAATPQGYTKPRTGYRGPLSLEMDGFAIRLNQEIHDIAFREAINNAAKLFWNPRFLQMITQAVGKEYADLLQPYLRDVANVANYQSGWPEALVALNELARQNTITVLVGYNPRTLEKHTLSAAMNSINEVGSKQMALAAWKILFGRDEATTRRYWGWALETFDELARRHQHWAEAVLGAQESAVLQATRRGEAGYFSAKRLRSWNYMMRHWQTWPVAFMDLASAVPTALGAYFKAIEDGHSIGDAVYAGNRAVRRAHGSTAITSRPAVMRYEPWLASLYGFFNHVFNQNWENAWKMNEMITGQKYVEETPGRYVEKRPLMDAKRGIDKRTGEPVYYIPGSEDWRIKGKLKQGWNLGWRLFAYGIGLGMIEELVSPYTNDQHESWGRWLLQAQLRPMASSMIVLREFFSAVVEKRDFRGWGVAGATVQPYADLYRDIQRREWGMDPAHAGKTIKHIVEVAGLLTGFTDEEMANISEYVWNMNHAREPFPRDYWRDRAELWRGATYGTTRPKAGPDIMERFLYALPGDAPPYQRPEPKQRR